MNDKLTVESRLLAIEAFVMVLQETNRELLASLDAAIALNVVQTTRIDALEKQMADRLDPLQADGLSTRIDNLSSMIGTHEQVLSSMEIKPKRDGKGLFVGKGESLESQSAKDAN